ncbi:MAG: histidine phosphatase family protein [Lautropia sp.]|nr:histidine phosphatase family protein [Lautropia sp.]
MAELHLVRHAQAAFGTEDYDRLTQLGHQQAGWLGDYFRERGMLFDRVLCGSLRRHRETLEGIGRAGVSLAPAQIDSRLDEYDPQRLVTAHQAALQQERDKPAVAGPLADTEASRREHFRLLRDALTAWTLGRVDPEVHRTFRSFQEDAYEAFKAACKPGDSAVERVLVVSSGGPISSIVAHHLDMPPSSFVALNLQVRNSGFCEIRFSGRGAHLISFNNVPHLDTPDRRRYITFS